MDLEKLGLDPRLLEGAQSGYPGRIAAQHGSQYRVFCQAGTVTAEVSGRFRFGAQGPTDFPAVGDFVIMDRPDDSGGNAIIHQLLPRKTTFIRKAAGTSGELQIVAANVDTIFLCMALNNDFNLRRLERYLATGWDSGAMPVVVLTKSDLCTDLDSRLREVESVAAGTDILVTSALEDAPARLLPYLSPGQTVAFIGSSGVGKSTLINLLAGTEEMATQGLRDDDKGRHTTTHRQLILLDGGAMVIDTPGMRELGLEGGDFARSFSDIEELAAQCRFSDCTHGSEPGCAVQGAVAAGDISPERLASWQKLITEAGYEGLDSRQIEAAKLERMFGSVGGMKNARKSLKASDKRKRNS